MNLVSRKVRQSIKFVIVTGLSMMMMSAAMPLTLLAQEGVIVRDNRIAQAASAKPAAATPQKDVKPAAAKAEDKAASASASASSTPATALVKADDGRQDAKPEAQNSITQPLALSPEVGTQRVGVREDQKQTLALQEAIAMALQNNLDVESFRQGVQISQYNLFSSYGVYDLTSSASINYRSQTFPVSSIFQGGDTKTASLTQRVLTYNFTTTKQVERTGGFYEVDFNNGRTNTSSTAATLTTQYTPTLTFNFTQPLMRNFKIDANRRAIQINKRNLDLSDSQFRQRVIEIISAVQRAYWDLVFAIQNERIARDTVELTRTQLSNNQKQVEAGTLAPIELRSTEAALEARKGDVILALQAITTAENTLKGLLSKDPNDKMWYSQLVPTDDPTLTPPAYSLEDSVALALKNRPELEQMRLQVQQKEIDLAYFNNLSKPQVDLIGIYTNTGLAGTPSTVVSTGGNIPASALVPERFKGGYFKALRNLFSQDFKTYQFGVSISFPWRNRTAEGNIGRVLAETRQLDTRQRQLVQNIQIDVRNALQAVVAAKQRFEAQQANRIAADAQYKGELEKFRAGLSTNFFVLQRQTDLSVARGNEIRALTDYNKALADLQRVTGLTLVSNNVQVVSPEKSDIK
ncbi:MAG: TolC family protein [Acidobacteria bacterium]|nr:TolC family protein [Acidobacteriota bacterium]